MDETWDQTAIERVEPELAAMAQAEMVWEEMERKRVEREELRRDEVEREEMERKNLLAKLARQNAKLTPCRRGGRANPLGPSAIRELDCSSRCNAIP